MANQDVPDFHVSHHTADSGDPVPAFSTADQLPNVEDLLDDSGAVKGTSSMEKLQKMMGSISWSGEAKYTLLTPLLHTMKQECLKCFVQGSGLLLLRDWGLQIRDSNDDDHVELLRHLLKVMCVLPMSLQGLASSQIGKLVRKLTKHNDPEVTSIATKLLASWMKLTQEAQPQAERQPDYPLEQPSAPKQFTTQRGVPGSVFGSGLSWGDKKGIVHPPRRTSIMPDHVRIRVDRKKERDEQQKLQIQRRAAGATAAVIPIATTSAIGGGEGEGEGKLEEQRASTSAQQPAASKKRKRVRWAEDSQLCQVREFFTDPGSKPMRATSTVADFSRQRQADLSSEKHAIQRERNAEKEALVQRLNAMVASIPWKEPPDMDGALIAAHRSEEVDTQQRREASVLEEVYLRVDQLPPSPTEPAPIETILETEDNIRVIPYSVAPKPRATTGLGDNSMNIALSQPQQIGRLLSNPNSQVQVMQEVLTNRPPMPQEVPRLMPGGSVSGNQVMGGARFESYDHSHHRRLYPSYMEQTKHHAQQQHMLNSGITPLPSFLRHEEQLPMNRGFHGHMSPNANTNMEADGFSNNGPIRGDHGHHRGMMRPHNQGDGYSDTTNGYLDYW